ncbi:MAG: hypothetical protein ABIP36_06210 [Acidimicrobiales bacterium]
MPDQDEPAIEDPTRPAEESEVPALDEHPDGHTPDQPTDSDEDSLPPGR